MKSAWLKSRFALLYAMLVACVVLPGCDWLGKSSSQSGSAAAQPTNERLLLVNVLDKAAYDDAHIKGSIQVPFEELEHWATTIENKTVPVVVYCANYMCSASSDAVKTLQAAGFKNVSAFEGGIAEWKHLGFPVEGPATLPFLDDYQKPEGYAPAADIKVINAQELKQLLDAATR
ncbi:MAG: rhodanese-like domain-containing protein [Candidatus Babeliales bacterium]